MDTGGAYWTGSSEVIETVWWLFRRIWDAGAIYEGFKVVPYCGRCGTAVSGHELGQPGAYRDVTEPSAGLGIGLMRLFSGVELPLADPTIIAGLRLATVSTISLITVGGAIGKGALGRMFSDGIERQIYNELWAGIAAVIVLALIADTLILALGRALTPWVRARAA